MPSGRQPPGRPLPTGTLWQGADARDPQGLRAAESGVARLGGGDKGTG